MHLSSFIVLNISFLIYFTVLGLSCSTEGCDLHCIIWAQKLRSSGLVAPWHMGYWFADS